MKYIEKQIIIDNSIENIFNKIYNSDDNYLDEYCNTISLKLGEWKVKKNIKQKNDEYYIYVPTLPEEYTRFILENDKCIRFMIKNKVKKDINNLKIVKTQYKLMNIHPVAQAIINGLELLKVKMITEIQALNCGKKRVVFKIFVNIYLPNSSELETYIANMCESVVNNLMDKLGKMI
jgi:hypothetical protein